MNKILEYFTRKRVLLTSIIFIILIPILIYLYEKIDYLFFLKKEYEIIIYFSLIFVPVLVFSIINSFLKRTIIFNIWRNFTFFYLIIYFLLIIIAPNRCDYLPFCKELTSIFFVLSYFIISLFIIIYQFFKYKIKEKNK